MELTPRYDDVPAIDLRMEPDAIRQPFLTQRRRLLDLVASLSEEQLAVPSRCDGWRVVDVLAHLVDVDRFWAASATSGVAGTPTRFLEHFDPEATPKTMVAGYAEVAPAEVVRQLVDATSELCTGIEALADGWWDAIAEAPPGHVTVKSMLAHALWDAWIHERDIAVPLGLEVVDDDAEVVAVLAYAASLSPAFGLVDDDDRTGRLGIAATEPDVAMIVDVADRVVVVAPVDSRAALPDDVAVIDGRAADLADALSQRGPLTHELDAGDRWMVDGLAAVFRPAS